MVWAGARSPQTATPTTFNIGERDGAETHRKPVQTASFYIFYSVLAGKHDVYALIGSDIEQMSFSNAEPD